jgi:hypothetical protein
MTVDNTSDLAKARAYAEGETRRIEGWKRLIPWIDLAVAVLVGVGAAILAAILTLHDEDLKEKAILWTFTVLAFGGGVVLFVWRLILQGRVYKAVELSPTDAYFRLQALEERCAELTLEGQTLRAWSLLLKTTNDAALAFVRQVNERLGKKSTLTNEEVEGWFGASVGDVVSAMENMRAELFGFEIGREIYFFDIFELRKDDFLYRVARRKHVNATEHNRRWKVGEGHIGDCVYRGVPVLVNYAVTPRKDYDQHPEPTDSEYFACRISVPIRTGDQRPHKAFGALCVTSSDSARLNSTHLLLCEILCFSLGTLFYERESALRRLNHPSRKGTVNANGAE